MVNSNLKEKGISIIDGWKRETQNYFDNITKGVTQCGAAPYFLLRPIEPLSETEYYLIQLQKVVSSETGFSNLLESYNNTKTSIKNDINKFGNKVYNSNTPYVSNFVGSLTNSSDYREKGPLDLENKAVNQALAISNVFSRGLITGGSTIVGDLSDIINDSNINMASVYGSQLGGLLEGGAKTIEGIADFGINPLGIKEGVSDFLRNEKENLPALWNKATDYVSHMSTEASPQEKARLEGRIMFEVLSIYALAKIGKLGEGAKAVQEGAVLEGAEQQTSKLSEIFKRRGVTINKTEAELVEGTGKAAGSGAAKEGAIEGSGPGIRGSNSTVNGFDTTVNAGKQGKHIVGNNNYIEGRSIFKGTADDAQRLVDKFAGTGEWIGANKERINFGEVIGQYMNPATGEAVDTTVGIIHYSKTGTHIVPAQPIQ